MTQEDEYMQYPAATRLLNLRFFNSFTEAAELMASPKSIRHSSSSLKIPKIVPVTMPTSILEEPSKGSNTAIYFEFQPSSIITGSSFSKFNTPIFPVETGN